MIFEGLESLELADTQVPVLSPVDSPDETSLCV